MLPLEVRLPLDPNDLSDLKLAATKYILPGYVPVTPMLELGAGVVTLGSCFAEHIAKHLMRNGASVYHASVREGLNTPGATDHLLSNIIERNPRFSEAAEKFATARLFVLTVGVALQVFLDGKEAFKFSRSDIDRAEWRMLTVEEITRHLRSIITKARTVNPNIVAVLTLSPIPMKKSIGHASVFGQDCLSKSLLRVAIENVLMDKTEGLFYWPSFEMIRWLGGHIGPFFGVGGVDNRHVFPDTLDAIMELFVDCYFRKS